MNTTNFNDLKPVNTSELKKVFAIVGKELSDKQKNAGYYLQVSEGATLDGIFKGVQTDATYDVEEVILETAEGKDLILKSCGSLRQQLSKVDIGSPIRIIYNGMQKLKSGKYKGKDYHDFTVLA